MKYKASQTTTTQTNLQDVVDLTSRLVQLVAEEVDLLKETNAKKIKYLQQENIFLVSALNAQRKLVNKPHGLMETIPSQDKHDLQEVADFFNDILAENNNKLLAANKIFC